MSKAPNIVQKNKSLRAPANLDEFRKNYIYQYISPQIVSSLTPTHTTSTGKNIVLREKIIDCTYTKK